MLPRLDKYLLSQLLSVWGLVGLVLVLVYWVNRAVRLVDALIADGQSAWVFLEFTALALPSIMRVVLPLAAFGATLWAVNRMGNDSELAAAQAAGASPWRLARPVLLFGLLAALVLAALTHVLAPAAAQRLAARQAEIAETATARLLREGEFASPAPGVTLYLRDLSPEGEIRDLLLSDSRDGASATYTAATAYLVRGQAGPQLVMVDGLVQSLGEDGRLVVTSFGDLAYDLGPLLGGAEDARRSPRELPTGLLLAPTPAVLAATGRGAQELWAEGQERLAEPLAAPVAALLAFGCLVLAPWGRRPPWRRLAAAVALLLAVEGAESSAATAVEGDPGLWPLLWLPPALGLLVAAALLALAAGPRGCPAPPVTDPGPA